MPIKLDPNETAFYPQPFVESEANLLVITNQRVVQFGDGGREEIRAKEVTHTGRASERPRLPLGAVLGILGLGMLITGIVLFLSVGLPSVPALPGVPAIPGAAKAVAAAANLADDPSGAPAEGGDQPVDGASASSPSDPTTMRIIGGGLGLVGLLMLIGGVLAILQQSFFVLVRGNEKMLKIRAKDKMQQTQILMTVQASQSGARAGASSGGPKPAMPAKPKVEVDDKGDPVKALQDLAMARQAGKIKDEEFQAKREVLLERVKNRG